MTDRIAKYAMRNVPRYTSYPTAPHFTDAVGSDTYAGWLADLDPAGPLSLYLHVPFCRQLCWYCGCNMKLAVRQEPITRYAHDLMREIDLVADRLPSRMSVSHLHWGGGTPTALSPDDLENAMAQIHRRFAFETDASVAIESDPRTLTIDMIKCIGRLGFTRASFGVQEFDRNVQAAINRIQPPEMVHAAVEGLRSVGVAGINFDLIYGLPHQSVATLLKTIETCLEMRPDRIALFGYAHVPWMAKKQRMIDESALPGAAERFAQAQASAAALVAAGYQAVGLDHFALPSDALAAAARNGTLRRNFQGYTTDQADALLGLGATSIGRTPAGYVQNIAETGAWARAVNSGMLPIARGYAFVGEDRARGYVIERLMCAGSVDLGAAGQRFGLPPTWYADVQADLDCMIKDGVIQRDGERISLSRAGATVVRAVAAAFDSKLATGVARHAVAV